MDTPTFPPPKDAAEQEVLDSLVSIRDKLQLLKQDRKTYMQKQHVIPLYQETVEQVRRLNESRSGDQKIEENRVDRVLDSCFQLLSLCFMTIGQNNSAPAAYALTATIKRLLDHLTEVDLFSAKDLESISETLNQLSRNIKHSSEYSSPYLITLLMNRLDLCKRSLASLQKRLGRLEDPLPKVHEKLISILRSISLANTRTKFSASEVKSLRAQLKEVDEKVKANKYLTVDGRQPAGSEDVDFLLRKCLLWSDIVLERRGVISEPFKATYDILVRIRNDLETLSITSKWSLREADLSYGYIYFLMISSNPVSEALQPTFNQLQTLKKCLIEVRNNGGVSTVRELYPYSLKLNSIDNLRVDGKFMFNGDIPEGQGSVNELLAECFEINYELRVAAEAAAEAADVDDDEEETAVSGDVDAEASTEALAKALEDSKLENKSEGQVTA
ncbi:conserved hypothetical protein [Verticillium alfalfae VaMs.102]|uniref:Uncharacterized protein n=1 Tax=Verticillium alfalfae (strain VaMs.102 / ATCC MYA-4576 / FGSC 10136) TaxID=526221 RepID=C9S6M1_VERA1|nr:conserved hypothetical protein [Verticillium alfalfae VaMs.102]EEY14512.1 conserved hypothetical protein [Verticillium alfalfae VaMs.102]